MNKLSPPPVVARRQAVSFKTAGMLVSYISRHQPCWSVGKYLGSLLYFDFGEAVSVDTRRGTVVDQGKFVLSIYNCFWSLRKGRKEILNSDIVGDDDAPMLRNLFAGSTLQRIARPRGRREVAVVFSNDCRLLLDVANRYGVDAGEGVAEFRRADGLTMRLLENGQFELNLEAPIRAVGPPP
jgi:hypothetical protein